MTYNYSPLTCTRINNVNDNKTLGCTKKCRTVYCLGKCWQIIMETLEYFGECNAMIL